MDSPVPSPHHHQRSTTSTPSPNPFYLSLLLLLEYSADFTSLFPISLSLLFLLTPLRRPFLVPLLIGFLLDRSLNHLIKHLVRRPRPLHDKNMNVAFSIDHSSFPSGHSSRVFFVAAFVCLSASVIGEGLVEQLRSKASGGFIKNFIGSGVREVVEYVVFVVWVWAVATSVSRVLLGRHFVSDVLGGACLGVLEALFVFYFLKF